MNIIKNLLKPNILFMQPRLTRKHRTQVKQYIHYMSTWLILLSSKYLIQLKLKSSVSLYIKCTLVQWLYQLYTNTKQRATQLQPLTVVWLWTDTKDRGSVVTANLNGNTEFLRYGNIVLYLPNRQQLVVSLWTRKNISTAWSVLMWLSQRLSWYSNDKLRLTKSDPENEQS